MKGQEGMEGKWMGVQWNPIWVALGNRGTKLLQRGPPLKPARQKGRGYMWIVVSAEADMSRERWKSEASLQPLLLDYTEQRSSVFGISIRQLKHNVWQGQCWLIRYVRSRAAYFNIITSFDWRPNDKLWYDMQRFRQTYMETIISLRQGQQFNLCS